MQHTDSKLMLSGHRVCDAEPIHIPGSIQPHGVLLMFDAASGTLANWAGDVSGLLGVEPVAGLKPSDLLGVPLDDLIGSRRLLAGEEAVFAGSIEPRRERLTAVVFRTGSFISVEIEAGGDVGSAADALERARAVSDQISSASTLADAYVCAAEHVRAVTGFDRVMVYQFLEDGSGSVVAEARSPEMSSYMGHRFPASDIPHQARELYLRNLIRVIPNVAYTPAPLQPGGCEIPIDMSGSVLRSVSPVHVQYLKNMDVGASMSVSLVVNGKLWGLIACHHRVPREVPLEARLQCRHAGATLSAFILCVRHAEDASRHVFFSAALEDVLHDIRASIDPEQALQSSAKKLAGLVDCSGFALLAGGELIGGAGTLPGAYQLRQLAPLLEEGLVGRECYSTDRLGELLRLTPEGVSLASGALAISIEAARPLLAVWLRAEQIEEICWAGDPRTKDAPIERLKALAPRRSFATWRETVRGRSRPWAGHEIDVVELLHRRAEYIIQRHRLEVLLREVGEANAALTDLAATDPLTGLPNRRRFDEQLNYMWQQSARASTPVTIVAIDVDNFKKYNDNFGHPAGDECLRRVAAALAGGCRQVDVAARLGGEEFGLLLADVNAEEAAALAERARLGVERLALDHPLNAAGVVTVSLGVASGLASEWGSPERLFGAADRALYEAKASGRNRVGTATLEESILDG